MPIKRSRSHRFAFDGREQVAASERQLTSQLSAAIVRRAEVARLRSLNDIGDEHDYNEHDTGNEQPVKWNGVGSLNDLAARITDLLVRDRREFWSINFNLRRSGTSDARLRRTYHPRELLVVASFDVIQRTFLSPASRDYSVVSSIASRLVTFETAAVGSSKFSPISNHCPCAIAMVPPYGKKKWRKDVDEWKRVGRVRIGSFPSRNEAVPRRLRSLLIAPHWL